MTQPEPKDVWAFALAPSGALAILAVVLWWRARVATGTWAWTGSGHQQVAAAAVGVSLVLAAVSTTTPPARRAVARAWMAVGNVIRRVLTFVLMTGIYFIILPVFALIRFRDPLKMRLRDAGTYWEDHEPDEPTVERASRPF